MGKNAIVNNMSSVCNTIIIAFFFIFFGEFYPALSLK